MRQLKGLLLFLLSTTLLAYAHGDDGNRARPESGQAPRTDRYGDPLPHGVLARLGTIRLRPPAELGGAAFTPDGKIIVSWCNPVSSGFLPVQLAPQAVYLWDADTGKLIRSLGEGSMPVSCAAVLPDGRRLITGDADQKLRLWDSATGKKIAEFVGHRNSIEGVAVSPDGKMLASASVDGTVRLWEVATAKELRRLAAPDGMAHSAAFTADGKAVAWVASRARDERGRLNEIRLSDVATGKELACLSLRDVRTAALSRDARLVAAAGGESNGSVTLWDLSSARKVREWPAQKQGIEQIRFAPDGSSLLLKDEVSGIRLWDCRSGREICGVDSWPANSAVLSPDGKTLATAGQYVRLWDTATAKERFSLAGHGDPAVLLAYTSDGKSLISRSIMDGVTLTWDVAAAQVRTRCDVLPQVGESTIASADGMLVALGSNWTHVFETTAGKRRPDPEGDEFRVRALAFSRDGKRLAACDETGKLRVWDVGTGKKQREFAKPQGGAAVLALAFSADGSLLVSADENGHIRYLRPATGDVLKTVVTGPRTHQAPGHDPRRQFRLSADGRFLGELYWGKLYLWDATTGQECTRFADQDDAGGWEMAVSPDGRAMLKARENRISLWEVASGRLVLRLEAPHNIWRAVFSPDARTVAASTGGDCAILLWDLTGLQGGEPQAKKPPGRLADWWRDLADPDAAKAYRAMWALASAPATVPFLNEHLHPVNPVSRTHAAKLLAALDDDDFAARERAMHELESLGDAVRVMLEKSLSDKPSAETQRRVERLLARLQPPTLPNDRLREVRAVAALEYGGSSEARQLLEALAVGTPEARLTQQAKAALERLARRAKRP
jgi:WD40 repeat protein